MWALRQVGDPRHARDAQIAVLECPCLLSDGRRQGLVWVSARRNVISREQHCLERGSSPYQALVFGNNKYVSLPKLNHCVNDADAMSTALERIGYTVTCVTDRTGSDMDATLHSFLERMPDKHKGTVILYFSGHGFSALSRTYLAGVDSCGSLELAQSFTSLCACTSITMCAFHWLGFLCGTIHVARPSSPAPLPTLPHAPQSLCARLLLAPSSSRPSICSTWQADGLSPSRRCAVPNL